MSDYHSALMLDTFLVFNSLLHSQTETYMLAWPACQVITVDLWTWQWEPESLGWSNKMMGHQPEGNCLLSTKKSTPSQTQMQHTRKQDVTYVFKEPEGMFKHVWQWGRKAMHKMRERKKKGRIKKMKHVYRVWKSLNYFLSPVPTSHW